MDLINYINSLEFWPTYFWGVLVAIPFPLFWILIEKGLTLNVGDLICILCISLLSWCVAWINIAIVIMSVLALAFTIVVVIPFRLFLILLETPFCKKKLF